MSEGYYHLLGVRSYADPDIIRAAYRVLTKKLHSGLLWLMALCCIGYYQVVVVGSDRTARQTNWFQEKLAEQKKIRPTQSDGRRDEPRGTSL